MSFWSRKKKVKLPRGAAYLDKKEKEQTLFQADCRVCGGKGTVPRAYYEPLLGMRDGSERVPCRKCTKGIW